MWHNAKIMVDADGPSILRFGKREPINRRTFTSLVRRKLIARSTSLRDAVFYDMTQAGLAAQKGAS